MKRFISFLMMLSLLTTMIAGSFSSSAQQLNKERKTQAPFAPPRARSQEFLDKLPPNIRRGGTPEAKAAWDQLTPEQREVVKAKVNAIFEEARAKAVREKGQMTGNGRPGGAARKTWKDIIQLKKNGTEVDSTTVFTNQNGEQRQFSSKERESVSALEAAPSQARRSNKNSQTSGAMLQHRNSMLSISSTSAPGAPASGKALWNKSGSRTETAFAHAPRAAAMRQQTSPPKTVDQFVADFYQGALGRQPSPTEAAQKSNELAQSQAQGLSQLIVTGKSLGYMLFQSQEYVNRGRSDRDYVYDLYKAWLQREPDQSGWDFWTGGVGRDGRAAVLEAFAVCGEFQDLLASLYNAASYDADSDYLTDHFEDRLADAFTPFYHISGYEVDQFATFNNSVPQTVKQRLGQTPISHYRVQPLGFDYNYYGQLVSVLRIDYLTLWDHDSGLVTGGACDAFPGLNSLEGMQAHDLDNERSAVLVAAPVWGYYYNTDPMAYSAYSYFTTAHEDTLTDKTRYYDYPDNPVPAGWHIHLASSLYKHGTYAFNPDYLPIVPDYIIYGAIAGVDYACYRWTWGNGYFGWQDLACLAAMYYAYGVFYGCAVERFIDLGGQYADRRINVGEPNSPINGSGFIQDDSHKLYSKLVNPVF